MRTFIIIYTVGMLINAFAAASVRDDLTEDKQLVRVRLVVVLFFVLASVGTWLYILIYLAARMVKSLFKRKVKPTKTDNNDSI